MRWTTLRPAATRPSAEQQDRKWEDLLQELRVMQTGAQLTAGFLLTLPFQDVFWERLSQAQEVFYLTSSCWPA